MKKVVKSSLEDYNRLNEEYNQAVSRRENQIKTRDRQEKQYRIMNKAAENIVSEYIMDIVEDATSSNFVESSRCNTNLYKYDGSRLSGDITFSYGEPSETPLAWSWEFSIGKYGSESGPERSTNSWSGLQATTLDDIQILRQSISALEALSQVTDEDIVSLMNKHAVRYTDYVTQEVDKQPRESSLIQRLEALAGTGMFILTNDQTTYYTDYLCITKDTGKQFATYTLRVTNPTKDWHSNEVRPADSFVVEEKRYRKDRVADLVKTPLELMSQDDIDNLIKEKNDNLSSSK